MVTDAVVAISAIDKLIVFWLLVSVVRSVLISAISVLICVICEIGVESDTASSLDVIWLDRRFNMNGMSI